VAVTPLQLLTAYAAVANKDGHLLRPHLARKIVEADAEGGPGQVRVIDSLPRGSSPASNPVLRRTLIEGFRRAVEDVKGTAYGAGFEPQWKVAGKTGSAQGRVGTPTHAWFVGFAPWDEPEICVVVLCTVAGHGGEVAAPLAKKFLETYFRVTRPKRLRALDSLDEPLQAAAHED
jgi:penicillin-binding protein 2